MGYVKGVARTSVLLCLLLFLKLEDLNPEEASPKLASSALDIRAHIFSTGTRADEALENMRLSVRGSIRTAPNVISTVIIITNLQKLGSCDLQGFIKRWNKISGKMNAITAKRASSLKLLLESAPRHVLDCILKHVEDSRAQDWAASTDSVWQRPLAISRIDALTMLCNFSPLSKQVPAVLNRPGSGAHTGQVGELWMTRVRSRCEHRPGLRAC